MEVYGRRRKTADSLMLIVLVLVVTVPLVAYGGSQVSEAVFAIEARNDVGSGRYEATFDDGEWDPSTQTFTWTLPYQVDIHDQESSAWVATLLNAQVVVRTAYLFEVEVDVAVLSGASETTFGICSPLVSFLTIPEQFAEGRAAASFGVTDLGGDGALLMGLGPPGTGAFRSYYNGFLSEGTRFTHLVAVVYVNNGGTANGSQLDPPSGFRSIHEDVGDMSTEIAFTLTPNDYATAVTRMGMPEPELCVGDVNGDGEIDFGDLGELVTAYGTSIGDPNYNAAADFDRDGFIGITDLAALLAVYGETCP